MRVVLDTNIYISALLVRSGVPYQIIQLFQDDHIEVVISPAGIAELERVLQYPRVKNRFTYRKEDGEDLLNLLRKTAILVEPQTTLDVVKNDESDNRFVEMAVEGGATYIVTGDQHLLQLEEYQGVQIIPPRAFLDLFKHD